MEGTGKEREADKAKDTRPGQENSLCGGLAAWRFCGVTLGMPIRTYPRVHEHANAW
jgi:hypothetical protein